MYIYEGRAVYWHAVEEFEPQNILYNESSANDSNCAIWFA